MVLHGLRDHLEHLAAAVAVVPGQQLAELRVLLAELRRLLRGGRELAQLAQLAQLPQLAQLGQQVRLVQDAHSARVLLLFDGLRVAGLHVGRRPVGETCAINRNNITTIN